MAPWWFISRVVMLLEGLADHCGLKNHVCRHSCCEEIVRLSLLLVLVQQHRFWCNLPTAYSLAGASSGNDHLILVSIGLP